MPIISKTNPINRHELTLMPPTPAEPNPFGWIRLRNGTGDAGYIYLATPPVKPHLSSDGSYIVTSMPMSELQTLLNIFEGEANLQIRYFDPQVAGIEPSVFIETASEQLAKPGVHLNVPDEIAQEIGSILAP